MKGKVCILTSAHPPFDIRIFHKQAHSLFQAGYDVTLIACHTHDTTVNGIKVLAMNKPKSRLARMLSLTWRIFRLALSQNANVYHFHDPELLPVGILLKVFTSGRVLYDVHEDYSQAIRDRHWIPKPIRVPVAWLVSLFEQVAVRILDRAVVVTPYIGAKFPPHKTTEIRNYPQVSPSPATVIRESGDPVLIYVGSLRRSRGIVNMVKAMEFLTPATNARLHLLGRFDEPDLEEAIKGLPGYRQVEYCGIVDHQEVWDHLQSSDIGMVCLEPLLAYQHSLPLKLFEYMAAGLPVISSDFPFWRQFVLENDCGLMVDPLNHIEIAEAVEALLADPIRARQMGENGRRAAMSKYTWESESKKLIQLYASILNNKATERLADDA